MILYKYLSFSFIKYCILKDLFNFIQNKSSSINTINKSIIT